MCRGTHISYFKINSPIFCCHLVSENYLNPQVRINKMVNKYTVDYNPSPSQLTPSIHHLIFLWTIKGFISPESLLNFVQNMCIPPWLQKSFEFMGKGGEGEDYGVEKIIKIKPTAVLVTTFDKFYHLRSLYLFGFWFAVP